jgi:PAS domain S-box-containing protein
VRINQPVFEAEYFVPGSEVLVSKTALNGRITYCNKAFQEASGFLENELLGQPHNIVRHPDVPSLIFADCWKTISAGNSWHGILKNRRKNGDYYWVDANITPLFEKGEWVGYVSLRYKPSTGQIARAKELYAAVYTGTLTPLLFHGPDKNYIGDLQQRLSEKIVALEGYNNRIEQEQKIAALYMDKLQSKDKLQDKAVQFYLKPAENFSGDLIALARTPDNRLHLMLADSTGHGLSAALAAMPMFHPFYSMTDMGFSISAIAEGINKKVWESLPVSHFVAAIIASIDTVSQMVEVWSGGCPPPFMLNDEGDCVHMFKARHLAMGILPPEKFDASVEYFSYENKECSLVMFSDGVIELENKNGEQFGLDRLLDVLRIADSDNRLKQATLSLENFYGRKSRSKDDITLMLTRCMHDQKTAQKISNHEQPKQEQFEDEIIWRFSLTFSIHQLKTLDVVPLLLDIVQRIDQVKEHAGEIFMILSELFNNALDYGVLKLDSSVKDHEDGMEKYFDERAARLAVIEQGIIELNLEKIHNAKGRAFLRIRVTDSGDGFDYHHITGAVVESTQRHGRGIPLLNKVCSKVQFSKGGSEILVEFEL